MKNSVSFQLQEDLPNPLPPQSTVPMVQQWKSSMAKGEKEKSEKLKNPKKKSTKSLWRRLWRHPKKCSNI